MSAPCVRAPRSPLAVLALTTGLASIATAVQDDPPRDAAKEEARLLSGIRQLTFEGRRAGEGYFSRDGRSMVFQSEREPGNPFYQIYLLDLELGDVRRISPGMGKTTCAWVHPDLDRVLYASTHSDPHSVELQNAELEFRASGQERRYAWDYDENFELYAHDLAGGENTRLTFARGYDAEGSYSPDGNWIAFSSNRHAFLEPLSEADQQRFEVDQSLMLEIYLCRADGTDVRRLTFVRGYDGGPFFDSTGKKICWRRFSEDGLTAEVFAMNVDGSDQRQLTELEAMSWAPYFHPSGEYLIFTTNRHGFANFELYLVDAKGEREPVRVTYTGGFDGLPCFSPDGDQLSWTTNRTPSGQAQIFLAGWNHEAALDLIGGSPARAPDSAEVRGAVAVDLGAAPVAGITVADLRRDVVSLTTDEMGGRFTGSEGEKLATQYVADRLAAVGVEPAGDGSGWFQPFETVIPKKSGGEQQVRGRNVLGVLRAKDAGARQRPMLVIGAHVDHLGTRGAEYSRAAGDEAKSSVHPGADDNASGVASMLEIAQYLASEQDAGRLNLQRDVCFAAWSGEELGLLGSKWYLQQLDRAVGGDQRPEHLRTHISSYLNLDMVGRLQNALIVSGIGSSTQWRGELERRNVPVGLALSLSNDAQLPTDATAFYLRGIPILSFFTGAHTDYHTPGDTADKLLYDDMQRITRLVALIARGLASSAEAPEYVAMDIEEQPRSARGGRVYLGTIPDYAKAPIPGLRLSGVGPGGPGDLAGLREGDIVVSLAGKEVKDIYDYSEILDTLKADVTVEVTIVRGNERKKLEITPVARN